MMIVNKTWESSVAFYCYKGLEQNGCRGKKSQSLWQQSEGPLYRPKASHNRGHIIYSPGHCQHEISLCFFMTWKHFLSWWKFIQEIHYFQLLILFPMTVNMHLRIKRNSANKIIFCICWDTTTEKTGLWQLPIVYLPFKQWGGESKSQYSFF